MGQYIIDLRWDLIEQCLLTKAAFCFLLDFHTVLIDKQMLRGFIYFPFLPFNVTQEKFTLGLDFPNLPYLKAGDVKLTQSLAILRFLARRHGLFPETEQNQQRVDLAEQQVSTINEILHMF